MFLQKFDSNIFGMQMQIDNRLQHKTVKQQRKSKQTNTHARNNKNNEGKQERNKTQMENMQSVTT
jgi:hypothetical protein